MFALGGERVVIARGPSGGVFRSSPPRARAGTLRSAARGTVPLSLAGPAVAGVSGCGNPRIDRDATLPPEPRPSLRRALGVRRPTTGRRQTQLARCRHAPALDRRHGIVRRLIFGTMKDGLKPAN